MSVICRVLSAALPLAFACLAAQAQTPPSPEQGFETAMQAYREGRYPTAYGRMILLADGGHPGAARMALTLHRWGPRLYGHAWYATPDQLNRWQALSADGRTGAALALAARP